MAFKHRYLVFAGELHYQAKTHLLNCIGSEDDLAKAKAMIEAKEHFNNGEILFTHAWGSVLDLETGFVRDWRSDAQFTQGRWYPTREVTDTDQQRGCSEAALYVGSTR